MAAPSSIKLKPADPFDLIRRLARSQSDPRKVVAELAQNSLNANVRHVWIERRRVRRSPALVIRDDGEGIVPEVARYEALRAIATNIGHSHKRGLTLYTRSPPRLTTCALIQLETAVPGAPVSRNASL